VELLTNTFLSFTEQPNISDRKNAATNAINNLYANDGAGQWRSEASARS